MLIATSKLSRRALNWAVAQASGRLNQYLNPRPRTGVSAIDISAADGQVMVFDANRMDYVPFEPATNPLQGHAIMEAKKISVFEAGEFWGARAFLKDWHTASRDWFGTTILEAAMRAFVADEMGHEIDVPNEFIDDAEIEESASPGIVQAEPEPKATADHRLYRLRLAEPRVGRRKPVVRTFIVLAAGKDTVLEAFDAAYGAHQREGSTASIDEWVGDVAPLNTAA